jgi:DNA-binding transcriptional LysR family regulator
LNKLIAINLFTTVGAWWRCRPSGADPSDLRDARIRGGIRGGICGEQDPARHPSPSELAARSAAFQPRIAYETRDYQLTLALIEAGLGISLVPASVLGRARHSGLTVRRLSGTDLARDISAPARVITAQFRHGRAA